MSTPSRHTFDATAEHILRLMATFEDLGRSTSTTELASILSASPSTVTTTLKRLSDQGYINYAPYRTPTLTQKGRKRGQRVSRKHKLIEQMLIRFLDMDWVEARWEAHRLEHAVSENLADRIEEALGGSVGIDSETSQAKALSSCNVGERVSVASITERDIFS
jgi:DtxR family Mn-dependent transcriptional regulator